MSGGECEIVHPWAGLALALAFPVPKQQKDLYKMVQPEPASGKLLNVSSLLPLIFLLAFKIKQIQKCKTKPLWDSERKETESKQQELARGS